MKPYTIIYTESWMSGCHMQTLVRMKRIFFNEESETFSQAIERALIDPASVIFAFEGHSALRGETDNVF